MCTSPISVRVKIPDNIKYHDRPRYLKIYSRCSDNELYPRFRPGAYTFYTVPCGKCTECLRKRQNDLAVRASIEANHRGSMSFVTLTYNPAHLPIAVVNRSIDKETGDMVVSYRSQILCSGCTDNEDLPLSSLSFHTSVRDEINCIKKSPSPVVVSRPYSETESEIVETLLTPSTCRRDIKLWLKSSRVAFEREFGHKLPDFSYVCCQEYGPKTCRPHAHIAFFGLPYKSVCWLAKRWSSYLHYGFHKVENVKAINKDGSYGFDICSRYIAKYCTKGVFECQSVKDRIAEKPRLMVSRGFGMSALTPQLVSYFRCEDLLGKCDPFSLRFPDGSKLSESDAKYIEEEVKKRSHWIQNGYKTSLPHQFLKKIWYVKDEETQSFRALPLRKALGLFAYIDPVEKYVDSLLQDHPGISEGLFTSLVGQFQAGLQVDLQARKERSFEYLRKQYIKSRY